MKKSLQYRQLERVVRGFSNHRRIQILELLDRTPELSVTDVSRELRVNFKTIAEHIRRLTAAGLLMKRNDYRDVRHRLTSLGKLILTFLRTLE